MKKKTFILGLGAPKSGTTWLHRYIDEQPVSNMGARKEYLIWPSKFADIPLKSKFNFKRLFVSKRGKLSFFDKSQIVRLNMFLREGYYERYFSNLVNNETWMTGDITPTYMTLDARQLRNVADRLRSAGFIVKVVFLMRDPVERSWSGARMRRRNKDKGFAELTDSEAISVLSQNSQHMALTRYDRTLSAIDEAFAPEEVFIGLFEELFSKKEMDRLSTFLDLPPRYDLISRKVNTTDKSGQLDPEVVADMKVYFAPVYEVCNERFPQTLELWR